MEGTEEGPTPCLPNRERRDVIVVSATNHRLFAQAAVVARCGQNKVRVGAVLAKGRTCLSEAYNVHRNDMANVEYGYGTVHAERMALRGHEHRFNCTLYVARLGLNGELRPSFPCDDCYDHIHDGSAVTRLVFLDQNYELKKVKM